MTFFFPKTVCTFFLPCVVSADCVLHLHTFITLYVACEENHRAQKSA